MTNEMTCVVQAIAAITGRPAAEIVAEISRFPNKDGGPAFTADGSGCYFFSYGAFLEELGWTWCHPQIDGLTIPATALIEVEGHAFAVVRGKIFDTNPVPYCFSEICGVWTLPTKAES